MAKGRILRLRGLPWSAREDDVRTFLGSHAPVDLFVLRRGGEVARLLTSQPDSPTVTGESNSFVLRPFPHC